MYETIDNEDYAEAAYKQFPSPEASTLASEYDVPEGLVKDAFYAAREFYSWDGGVDIDLDGQSGDSIWSSFHDYDHQQSVYHIVGVDTLSPEDAELDHLLGVTHRLFRDEFEREQTREEYAQTVAQEEPEWNAFKDGSIPENQSHLTDF